MLALSSRKRKAHYWPVNNRRAAKNAEKAGENFALLAALRLISLAVFAIVPASLPERRGFVSSVCLVFRGGRPGVLPPTAGLDMGRLAAVAHRLL